MFRRGGGIPSAACLHRHRIMAQVAAMAAEKQESGTLAHGTEPRGGNGFGQATEALEGLRSVVDQASRAVRDLTQASQQWSQVAQERAREMGQELRNQGERAVAGVSQQVEQNPLTSLVVAFALGYLVANLTRR